MGNAIELKTLYWTLAPFLYVVIMFTRNSNKFVSSGTSSMVGRGMVQLTCDIRNMKHTKIVMFGICKMC